MTKTVTSYTYGQSGTASYMLGHALSTSSASYLQEDGTGVFDHQVTSRNTYTYALYQGAVQRKIVYDGDTGDSSNALTDTDYAYNWAGHLVSADIDDDNPTDITYINNIAGEIVGRSSHDLDNDSLDRYTLYHRFAGRQVGEASFGRGNFTQLDSPGRGAGSDAASELR